MSPRKKKRGVERTAQRSTSDPILVALERECKRLRATQQPCAEEFWSYERQIAKMDDEILRRMS